MLINFKIQLQSFTLHNFKSIFQLFQHKLKEKKDLLKLNTTLFICTTTIVGLNFSQQQLYTIKI